MNNIICDFIPVLEIKGGCEQDDDKHMVAEMLIGVGESGISREATIASKMVQFRA